MNEFLQNISTQEWFIALVAYLTANLGALLLFGVKLLASKNNNTKLVAKLEEIESKHVDELDQLRSELLKYGKSAIDEKIRKEDEILEAKSTKLAEVTKDNQENLTIDDILE